MTSREETKDYLMKIRNLVNDIIEKEEHVQRLRDSLDVAGISYDKERVQCSPELDKFAHVFAQIDKEEKVLEDLKTKLIETRVRIINMICKLENEKYKKLLNVVYVDLKSLKAASNIMSFSYDYIKELHLEALDAFFEKFLLQTP